MSYESGNLVLYKVIGFVQSQVAILDFLLGCKGLAKVGLWLWQILGV